METTNGISIGALLIASSIGILAIDFVSVKTRLLIAGFFFTVGVAFLIVPFIWPKKEPIESPNISAKLVIDAEIKNDFTFHLQIENLINSQDVSNLRCIYKTDMMKGGEMPAALLQRVLQRGRSLYIPGPLFTDLKKSRVLYVDLIYQGSLNGVDTEYTSRYGFILPSGNIIGKSIDPTIMKNIVGNVGDDEMVKSILKGLEKKEGTLSFMFPEKYEDGSPNNLLIESGNKRLMVNGITGIVVFQVGLKIAKQKIDVTSNGRHMVVVVWSKTGKVTLWVDAKPQEAH